jgi:hypothetical protein
MKLQIFLLNKQGLNSFEYNFMFFISSSSSSSSEFLIFFENLTHRTTLLEVQVDQSWIDINFNALEKFRIYSFVQTLKYDSSAVHHIFHSQS